MKGLTFSMALAGILASVSALSASFHERDQAGPAGRVSCKSFPRPSTVEEKAMHTNRLDDLEGTAKRLLAEREVLRQLKEKEDRLPKSRPELDQKKSQMRKQLSDALAEEFEAKQAYDVLVRRQRKERDASRSSANQAREQATSLREAARIKEEACALLMTGKGAYTDAQIAAAQRAAQHAQKKAKDAETLASQREKKAEKVSTAYDTALGKLENSEQARRCVQASEKVTSLHAAILELEESPQTLKNLQEEQKQSADRAAEIEDQLAELGDALPRLSLLLKEDGTPVDLNGVINVLKVRKEIKRSLEVLKECDEIFSNGGWKTILDAYLKALQAAAVWPSKAQQQENLKFLGIGRSNNSIVARILSTLSAEALNVVRQILALQDTGLSPSELREVAGLITTFFYPLNGRALEFEVGPAERRIRVHPIQIYYSVLRQKSPVSEAARQGFQIAREAQGLTQEALHSGREVHSAPASKEEAKHKADEWRDAIRELLMKGEIYPEEDRILKKLVEFNRMQTLGAVKMLAECDGRAGTVGILLFEAWAGRRKSLGH